MKNRFLLSAIVVGCLCSPVLQNPARGATRISEDVSRGWRFLRDDAAGAESPDYQEGRDWKNVDLPHTWNIEDTFDDEPGYYRGAVTINFSAIDMAPNNVVPGGVLSINYILDGVATTTIPNSAAATAITAEGNHNLKYYAVDKLGNREIPRTISFVIDKTPPELQFIFDQSKKDLVFSATDNYSRYTGSS